MNIIEVVLFVFAVVAVIGLGIWKSRDGETNTDSSASGFFSKRTPRFFGMLGIVLNIVIYGLLYKYGDWIAGNGWWYADSMAFLDRMSVTLIIIIIAGIIVTIACPMKEAVAMPVNDDMDVTESPGAKLCGYGVIVATLLLYAMFW